MTVWIIVAAAVVAACIFLGLWLAERARNARLRASQEESDWDRWDRELDLAEQTGRFRIVADLGDVAVQSVSRLVAQAEAVRFAASADPEAAVRATAGLEAAAREALADLRRLRNVAQEGLALEQLPSLQSVGELFAAVRERGLAVTFTERGDRFELRPGAEVAVLRILQVSLENALEHGGPGTTAAVGFAWTADGLQVSVDDDGIRAAASRLGLDRDGVDRATAYGVTEDVRALTEQLEGAGLAELRERASLFGGSLTARVVPGVGFSIAVVFPALRHHNGVHGVDLAR